MNQVQHSVRYRYACWRCGSPGAGLKDSDFDSEGRLLVFCDVCDSSERLNKSKCCRYTVQTEK